MKKKKAPLMSVDMAAVAANHAELESPHVISLGAGVQSSTLALLAAKGMLTPMPVAAVFADTQAEPPAVMIWLAKLETMLPFPVIRVTRGPLEYSALDVRISGRTGLPFIKTMVPAHVYFPETKKPVLALRHCTETFKIDKIQRELIRIRLAAKSKKLVQWIGISTDEADRMKPSIRKRVVNTWPLIELGWSRKTCEEWLAAEGLGKPPKSACYFCGFRSKAEWLDMRDTDPDSFQAACTFEEKLRVAYAATPRLKGQPFLTQTGRPLAELADRDNQSHWGNECGGICGV